MSYYITTDATCDLPEELYDDNFAVIPMAYMINGEEYGINKFLPSKDFYDQVRSGAMPTTALINSYFAKEFFTPILKEGKDILHICFSSALSGSYNNLLTAQKELQQEFPNRKIFVIDSKCACSGEGLLVYYALKARRDGKSVEDNYKYIEELKDNVSHYFTPEDLFHLQRGGRVSKAAALFGTMLGIKPVLYCNINGTLQPVEKVKGRKKALNTLVDKMIDKMLPKEENELVIISQADSKEDAEYVAQKIKERTGIENIVISNMGPVIGSHAGAGTIALFFLGQDKIDAKDISLK